MMSIINIMPFSKKIKNKYKLSRKGFGYFIIFIIVKWDICSSRDKRDPIKKQNVLIFLFSFKEKLSTESDGREGVNMDPKKFKLGSYLSSDAWLIRKMAECRN